MIQAVLLIALGFFTASLIGVLIAPALWHRAYRLARKRLERSLPTSLTEIEASRDQLRAVYAVRMRRLETALASAKQKAAMELVGNSRLQMQIVGLKDEIAGLEFKLAERQNATTVLEQTITKRFPELDREITSVKRQLQDRAFELQDLTNKLARRSEELEAASREAASHHTELSRLREALEKNSADRTGRRVRRASQWSLDDYRAEYDRLNLELSRLRQQLAQLQDKDAQQAGVIKGELQRLADLILVSAQPKPAPAPIDFVEAATKRVAQAEPRDRPASWLDVAASKTAADEDAIIDHEERAAEAESGNADVTAQAPETPAVPAKPPASPPLDEEKVQEKPAVETATGVPPRSKLLRGAVSSVPQQPPKNGAVQNAGEARKDKPAVQDTPALDAIRPVHALTLLERLKEAAEDKVEAEK